MDALFILIKFKGYKNKKSKIIKALHVLGLLDHQQNLSFPDIICFILQ